MTSPLGSTTLDPHFWHQLGQGSFELPRCDACGAWRPPSAGPCVSCGSEALTWSRASGTGAVYSLMERHRPPGEDGVTTVIVVVELDESPRLMAALHALPRIVHVGMRVEVVRPAGPGPDGLPLLAESSI